MGGRAMGVVVKSWCGDPTQYLTYLVVVVVKGDGGRQVREAQAVRARAGRRRARQGAMQLKGDS